MGVVSVAIGAVLIFLSIGSMYSEGNIATYVVSYMRIHRHALSVDNSQQIWFLSASLGLTGPGSIVGGFLLEKFGVTVCVLLGGGVLTAGMFLCCWALQLASLPVVVLFCAACTGIGAGIIYIGPLKVLMTWMPKRTGFASGLLVGAMTIGGGIHSALQGQLMNPQGEEMVGFVNGYLQCSGFKSAEDFHRCCADATGGGQCELYFIQDSVLTRVPEFFWKIGIIHLVLLLLGALLIRYPEEGEVANPDLMEDHEGEMRAESLTLDPPGSDDASTGSKPNMIKVEATWSEMIRTRPFRCLVAIFFCNGHIVTFIVASCKHLGNDLFEINNDSFLTWLLLVTMIFNSLGRLSLGALADRFGYKNSMVVVATALSVFIALLSVGKLSYGGAWEKPTFAILICIIAFFMGGNFSIAPALAGKYFGMEHFGINYGFIFCGVSAAAIEAGVTSSVLYYIIGALGFVIFTSALGVVSIVCALYLPSVDEFHEDFLRRRAEASPLLGNPQC